MPPNKRLKLTGVYRFKGILSVVRWWPPGNAEPPCAGGRVARTLSAIR